MQLIHHTVSPHQELFVYETYRLYGQNGRFRLLQFSETAVQGAMDLNRPERILFEYPQAMIHLMEHHLPEFRSAFMIGLGIGTIPRHFPANTFKIAELDEEVIRISREYFGYTADNVAAGDGRNLLAAEPPASLDFILVDAFNPAGTPRHLTSLEFFRLADSRLASKGAVILNLAGKESNDRHINAIHTTLARVFKHTAAYVLPSSGRQCNILLAGSHMPVAGRPSQMAGFREAVLEEGHCVRDPRSWRD
ncbi:spermidine synthase [Paenibacillus sp. YN15]|uniref:spermidine synthase n=1 Tax=Paenibacillus sp. YN15 TaxID=1742774 RepID=UPI000DCC596F|nr:fused MFS/spermidine synthase [Paenibacillus sp. YN15]RAU98136.1 spermidine synthase [Paenibacillus sp. YN15]